MGAHDYIVTFNVKNKNEVKEAWSRLVEEDAHESGSGAYAGNATTMGKNIEFRNSIFDSESKAYDYILDNHQKWSSPIACSFYLPSKPKASQEKKINSLKEALRKVREKKFHGMTKLCESFFERKSSLVGCSKCLSRLNLKLLKHKHRAGSLFETSVFYPSLPKCPLCEANLMSDTGIKRVAAWSNKESIAELNLKDAEKPTPSKEIAWAVGGWAAS